LTRRPVTTFAGAHGSTRRWMAKASPLPAPIPTGCAG
jgi:hypothetical protein